MKNKVVKKTIALLLVLCLTIPAVSFGKKTIEAEAATTTTTSMATSGEVGDTDGDGVIDSRELVRIKKSTLPTNRMAELHFAKFIDSFVNFVTAEAYPGGSTVTFDAYMPTGLSGTSWWGVAAVTDLATGNYYTCAESNAKAQAKAGEWATITIQLPEDSQKYYIGFGGDTGTGTTWSGTSLMVDNFKVVSSEGVVLAEDDFNDGFEEGCFAVQETGKDWTEDGNSTAVTLAVDSEHEELKLQADLNNDGKNNKKDTLLMRQFLTDEIYSFFRSDTSSVNNDTSAYQVTDELEREMTETKSEKDKQVGIRYFLHHGTQKNHYAEVYLYYYTEDKPTHIITKNTYAGGSVITFRAKAPENISWWGVGFSPTASNIGYTGPTKSYSGDPGGVNLQGTTTQSEWAEYTVTLPEGGPYYFTLSGETGAGGQTNWGSEPMLIDDFKVTGTDGTILAEDDFENGLSGGIFDITETGYDYSTGKSTTAIFYKSELVESDETAPLYSVSQILANDADAFASSSAWLAAGGGEVGETHWWGEPVFGYYSSLDEWVVERDVQMLTDAGIDFLAIDVTDNVVFETQLTLLLQTLDKYYQQGFNVPKVTFTSDVSDQLTEFYNNEAYEHLWYQKDGDNIVSTENLDVETVRAASNVGAAASASAFYGETTNHQRNYNGKKHVSSETAVLEGRNFKFEFNNAIDSGTDTVLVESWNEWVSTRTEATSSEQPIVLYNNADMANSSDFQPMNGGYGDNYYMQLISCIRDFKGNSIANRNLNTASTTESVTIDIDGDFKQWNKVSTHYLDYTDDITQGVVEAEVEEETIEVATNNRVAIDMDNLPEATQAGQASFVTKKSYPDGTKISVDTFTYGFKATDGGTTSFKIASAAEATNVYGKTNNGYTSATATSDKARRREYTLSNEEGYFYFTVGDDKANTWNGNELYIDNVVITLPDGTVETDNFENGLDAGLFNANAATRLDVQVKDNNDQAAAIHVDNLNSGSDVSADFITKYKYPAGSIVSFKVYEEGGVGAWWRLSTTSDPSKTSIYSSSYIYDPYVTQETVGKWRTVTATLTEDSYIFFAGAVGEWGGNRLFIDDFTVTKDGIVIAYDDFDNVTVLENDAISSYDNFEDARSNLFTVNTACVTSEETPKDVQEEVTGTDVSYNDISRMKMTTDGEYLYALVETVDDIVGFGEANRMTLFLSDGDVGGCWNQYEYVVNRDSSKASDTELIVETYIGGAWVETGKAAYRMEGNLMHVAIPLSALGNTDALEMEFKWADNYSEEDIYSFYKTGDTAPYGRVNYVYQTTGQHADITINKMGSAQGKMSFITNRTFPGGSTVSFDILVPENLSSSWWGICWTTDPSKATLYDFQEKYGGMGKTITSTIGKWTQCSIDLPDEGNYYVYLVAAVGEWPKADANAENTVFSIDNVVVRDASENVIAKDTFNGGSSLFTIDENAVTLVSEASDYGNQSAEIHIQYLNTASGGWNFITKNFYPKGTKIVFDAYIPAGSSGNWWGAVATTDPSSSDIYDCAGENSLSMSTTNKWVTFEKTITEDGSYFAIGGPAGEWTDRNLFIDNVKIYNADGVLIAKDDFRAGLHQGLFKVTELTGSDVAVSLGTPSAGEETASGNNVVSLVTNASEAALAMTATAYPAGSTVTFDAYVPNGATWWGVRMTEDPSSTSIYSSTGYQNYQDACYEGGWSSYTATLPESGGPYYFYFVTECAAWTENVKIDNIVVKNANGKVLVKDDFNDEALDDSMLTVLNSSAVSLVAEDEDTVDVHFTAYDAPTINGQVNGTYEAQIDAAYKALADAGFTKALALREGYTTIAKAQETTSSTAFEDYVKWRTEKYAESATTVLDIAEKYGLSYYVKDWSFYNLGKTQSGDEAVIGSDLISAEADFETVINTVLENSPFLDHSAYAGHYATDEPADSTTDFNALKMQAKYYNQFMADKGLAGELNVNLTPAYGTQDDRTWYDKWFGDSTDYKYSSSYKTSYLQKYLDVATADESKINYISWDYYPFMVDGNENKQLREENYLYNFNVMAQAAKDNELGLRFTLQSTGEDDYGLREITSAADFRFQIYTGMAFGVNDFTYYKYSGKDGEGIFDYETGETNETVLGYAKEVNNEVHAIEDFFADYKWNSVMVKQGTNTTTMSDNMITGAQLASDDSISYGRVGSVTATQDTLCGIFDVVDENATTRPYGYMFVNIADPTNNATDTVTIQFTSGVTSVCICQGGVQKVVKVSSSNPTYTLTLAAGEGAFIVPMSEK